MSHKTLILALLLLCAGFVNAQTVPEKKPTEDAEKLQKEAVAFLRETMADVNNMRSLENRISFAAEMAALMWFHDEKESKAMFASVVGDFKELLMRYDAQMNSFGLPASDGEDAGYFGMIMAGEVTEKVQLSRKFNTAMAVRQQVAMSIAEHDADLAYGFYYDSLNIISNAEFRKQMESRDTGFEFQLMNQIAETNAARAAQFGVKTLSKGLNYQHVELLKKIHKKDAEKGVAFAAEMLNQVKCEKLSPADFWVLSSLLSFGNQTLEESRKQGGKKPVYSQQELRELADAFAQTILNNESDESTSGLEYADEIEKFQPSRAMQIRAKFNNRKASSTPMSMGLPPPAYRGSGNTAVNVVGVGSGYGSANSNSARNAEREQREEAERKMMEDVKNVGTGEVSKEQREKIVAQARKILMSTPGKDKKIIGLSILATQVAKSGDKELAAEIMRDAQSLVNPNPKHFQDFTFTLMLAAGYAEADPEKAFPILEDTIMRANDLLAAFVKVGEFMDVAEEMIVDGEVQVGAFGGQMIRGLTKELATADKTIHSLVKADFAKTKNLANRFDRPEVRILAKMMVLRAVLGDKSKAQEDIQVELEVK